MVFEESNDSIKLKWRKTSKIDAVLTISALKEIKSMLINVDGQMFKLYKNMSIRNQYQWVWLYQSKKQKGNEWSICIQK